MKITFLLSIILALILVFIYVVFFTFQLDETQLECLENIAINNCGDKEFKEVVFVVDRIDKSGFLCEGEEMYDSWATPRFIMNLNKFSESELDRCLT